MNSTDLIEVLLRHKKMQDLLSVAATAYVERETGAVAGVARAMQAATNPSEGQRLLQEGFEGAVINGESRENTTIVTDAGGNIAMQQRVVERGVVSADGQQVLVQQVQQIASPEIVTVGVLHTCLTGIASAFDKVKIIMDSHDMIITGQDAIITGQGAINAKNAALVDLVATSITTLHVHVDKKMEVFEAKMDAKDREFEVRNQQLEAKTQQMEAKTQQMEAKNQQLEAKTQQMEAKNQQIEAKALQIEGKALQLETQREEIEKRLTSLETSKKRSRKAENKDSPKIIKNISFANGVFAWRKTIKKTKRSKSGYKTIVDAQKGLTEFCEEQNTMTLD